MQPLISALVHTRNEARNIADCLASLKWADEIVVADMASSDRTTAIAESLGARVIAVEPAPVVEPARNAAIAECRGDWVLIVDADERVPQPLAEKLRSLSRASDAAAIALPRRNYFLGTWMEHGFWPDYQVRFVRKSKASWSGVVHELPAVDGRVDQIEADPVAAIEHPGYGDDLQRFVEKLVRYSPLEAQRLANGSRPAVWPYVIRRPVSEFYERYFVAAAWKHGMTGLVWSLLLATYQLLIAAHYWGLKREVDTSLPPADLRRRVRLEAFRTLAKWLRP